MGVLDIYSESNLYCTYCGEKIREYADLKKEDVRKNYGTKEYINIKKKQNSGNRKRIRSEVKQEPNEINTEIISQVKRNNIHGHVEKFRKHLLKNNVNIILSDSLNEVENILIAMFAKNGYWQQKKLYSMPERIL